MIPAHVPLETKSPMKRPRAGSLAFTAEQSLFSCKMKEIIDSLFQFNSTERKEAAIIAALEIYNHLDVFSLPSMTANDAILTPSNIRAISTMTLDKFCLRDEALAKASVNLL